MRKNLPTTVDQAVEELSCDLSLRSKNTIAYMVKEELANLQHSSLAMYISNNFGLHGPNHQLVQSCCLLIGASWPDPETACFVIIQKLWERLKETHRLRVIK